MKLYKYDWLWVIWWIYFGVVEGIAIAHTAVVGDGWTLTHFLSTVLPIGLRAGFLGWLIYHFLVEHKKG